MLSDSAILAEIRDVLASPLFVGEGHRKVWARLRYERGIRTSMRRTHRIMREHGILACSRPIGARPALRGTRFEAMECLREAIRTVKGRYEKGIGAGTKLRHDHGSQFISHAFQNDLKTLGIESSPSFVGQPEGNGCVERFIRTLKEQLHWLHRFHDIAEVNQALRSFAHRLNNHGIIGRIGYRTPAAHRRILRGKAA